MNDREETTKAPPTAANLSWWTTRLRAVDWSTVLAVLSIKALIFFFAILSVRTLARKQISWEQMWSRWDSLHYLAIAEHGYAAIGQRRVQLAFFPHYPGLVRIVAFITDNYLTAALIVSGIASIAAALILQRLARLDESPAVARGAVWFMFIFPTSYFLHIGYTESLFLALTLGCVLAVRTDRWFLAGVLAGFACLTRVNGLLLAPLLAVEALQQFRLKRRFDVRWLWIALVGLGFAGYLWVNYRATGDPLVFTKIQEQHWYKRFTPPWVGIRDIWFRTLGLDVTQGFHELFFIVLGLAGTVWCWFRLRPSYAVWMTLNWLLITSTSFITSVPRFLLIFFPLFILFAQLAVKRPLFYTVATVWSLLFLALFVTRFVQGHWAF